MYIPEINTMMSPKTWGIVVEGIRVDAEKRKYNMTRWLNSLYTTKHIQYYRSAYSGLLGRMKGLIY